jgi:hypothetical protein
MLPTAIEATQLGKGGVTLQVEKGIRFWSGHCQLLSAWPACRR